MSIISRALRSFGYVRLRDYGYTLTADGRIVELPRVTDDRFAPPPWEPAAWQNTKTHSPLRPPQPVSLFAPSPAPDEMVGAQHNAQAPVTPAPASVGELERIASDVAAQGAPPHAEAEAAPADEDEEEWEWQMALARARAEDGPMAEAAEPTDAEPATPVAIPSPTALALEPSAASAIPSPGDGTARTEKTYIVTDRPSPALAPPAARKSRPRRTVLSTRAPDRGTTRSTTLVGLNPNRPPASPASIRTASLSAAAYSDPPTGVAFRASRVSGPPARPIGPMLGRPAATEATGRVARGTQGVGARLDTSIPELVDDESVLEVDDVDFADGSANQGDSTQLGRGQGEPDDETATNVRPAPPPTPERDEERDTTTTHVLVRSTRRDAPASADLDGETIVTVAAPKSDPAPLPRLSQRLRRPNSTP